MVYALPVRAETILPRHDEAPVNISLGLNSGFDDAVFVKETDTGTSSGDEFLETELGIDWRIGGKSGGPVFELGYDYSRTDYEDVSDFDLQSHQVHGAARAKIGMVDGSVTYSYRHIKLAGEPLLKLHVVTPTLSMPIGNQLIGLVTYSYTRKRFATLPDRDATGHQVSATLIKLLDTEGSYIFAGGGIGKDRARAPEFHNNSVRLDISATKVAPFHMKNWEISASAAYERLNYTAFNPLVPGLRRDRDYDLSLRTKYALTDRLSAQVEFERNISKSSLEFARYSGNKVQFQLLWEI